MPANPKVRVEITAIDRATATIKGVSNQISNISSSLMKLGAAYATVRVGFAAFEQLTTGVAAYAEEILIAGQKTGMSTEQISALRFAAKQDNIEFEALTKSLGIFSRNLVGVGGKGKDTERVLGALGLASRDAGGQILPMHDLLLSVADRFSKMQDGAQKAAAAQALFGKSGADLIPFLNQGASGIEELEKKAAALGITLDEKSARAADAFGDQMVTLGEMVHGVTLAIATTMMPTLLELTVAVEQSGLKIKQWCKELEAGVWGIAAIQAAWMGLFPLVKGFWANAKAATAEANELEIKYQAAVSKGTGELDRRIKTMKALGDVPDLGAPKEDKDAKRRLEEITKAFQQAQEAAAAYNKHLASIVDTLRQSWDPTIEAAAKMEELNQAFARGIISGPELSRGIAEIQAELAALNPTMIAQHEALVKVEEDWTRYQQSLDSAGKSLQESLQGPAEKATAQLRELTVLLGTGRISAEEFSLGVKKIQAGLENVNQVAKQFEDTIVSGFTQMIVYGRGGMAMLQSLIALLVEATLRSVLFGESFQGTGQGSGSGLVGQGVSGLISALGSYFGGGRQAGGSVGAHTPYLVGEGGPELFVPSMAGSIVSNRYLRGGDVILNYTIDARGADPTVDMRLRRMLREVHRDAIATAGRNTREHALRSGG